MLELLKERGFKAVYCIDDENAVPHIDSLEALARAVVLATSRRRKRLAQEDAFFNDVLPIAGRDGADTESRQADVRAWLEEQDPEELSQARLQFARKVIYEGYTGPTHDRLRKQLHEAEVELRAFSFREWKEAGHELLATASMESRILLLVDEINDVEPEVDLNGQDVLADVYATQQDRLAFIDAIVVTSNCEPDAELEESQKIYEEVVGILHARGLEQSFKKVFVLSKERLSDHSLVTSFEWHLNRIEAARLSIDLAEATKQVLESAVGESLDWLKRIPLLEFHHSIFVTATNEGAAEIDTLIRLASIKQRVALEKLLRDNAHVQTLIEEMRKMTRTGLGAASSTFSTPMLKKLREEEFERAGDHINVLRAPLASGDVFKIRLTSTTGEESEQFAMLLVNPCDLVIRQDGKRKLTTGLLVEVEKVQRQQAEQTAAAQKSGPPLTYRLATGHADDDIVYVFQNSRVESVPLYVLDLCWTNARGTVELIPSDIVATSESLTPPQRARLMNLVERSEQARFSRLEMWGHDVLHTRSQVSTETIQQVQAGWSVAYPIQRVWRLAPEFAAAALAALAQSLSRPVFGHDYRQR